jgi:hypothetical protein
MTGDRVISRLPKPSPALVLAIVAIVAVVVGTAVADPGSQGKPVSKAKVKKIARAQVRQLAPKLHVASADSASEAQHAADASALQGAGLTSLQGRIRWALVDQNGGIVSQSGGVRVTGHPTAGVYYLDFGVQTSGKAILVENWYPQTDLGVTAQTMPCGDVPDGDLCNANGDPGGNPNDGKHIFVEISKGNSDVSHGFYVALIP